MAAFDQSHEFLLFAGETYYPLGGWGDFRGSFSEREDALIVGRAFVAGSPHHRWFHVASVKTGEEVRSE